MKKKITIFDIFNIALFSFMILACLYPFYYVLIYSFSNATKAAAEGVFLWPVGFNLVTYKAIFAQSDILHSFFISLSRTVIGTSITIICTTFLSYLFTRERMLFRTFVYRFLIITMYLNAGLIPWYLTMKAYGLKNSFLLYIIPSAISAFYVILVKTYIESIPRSLEEAAQIDGAGLFSIFVNVTLPLCKPIIATIAVFECVGQWNAWMDNYFLVTTDNLKTLQLLLYNVLMDANRLVSNSTRTMVNSDVKNMISPQTLKMCITLITTAPILFAYPFLQRYFVKGIMLGAVKG